MNLNFQYPEWALPFLEKARYKGAKGGRASGKSHERAEALLRELMMHPNKSAVCIREIQKSLAQSSKRLLEKKIRDYQLNDYFQITNTEIRRKGGDGIIIFQGMQDHTADSIKSLEDFHIAWVEEAQRLSAKSLKMLRPTLRAGSELWFTWNPDQPTDPVDAFFESIKNEPDCILIHVNYTHNPFLPPESLREMQIDKERYPEDFDHIWLGGYNLRSETRVFKHWHIEEFEHNGEELYYGADWGFSQDPTTLLRCWINEIEKKIYIDYQVDGIGVEIDKTPQLFDKIPEARKYLIRADSARPETISYMRRQGFNLTGVQKGKGSVEDGVEFLKAYNIVIHPRCTLLEKELRLYSYKQNRAGDITPKLEDKHNHCIDALRYAIEPLIKNNTPRITTL